jgi:hypothetical protein
VKFECEKSVVNDEHSRTNGMLKYELEAGGDVGDLDQLDGFVEVIVGENRNHVTLKPWK